MLNRLLIAAIVLLTANPLLAATVGICHAPFALCAASGTTPTGNKIVVNGTTFDEGMSVCPVLTGDSVADLDLMNGSCDSQPGWVWSLFAPIKSFPQAPTWKTVTAQPRTFVTTSAPGGGMSNMWSFPCKLTRVTNNGVVLAECLGPMNESPNGAAPIPAGTKVITQAPIGVANPVGGNVP
jgi:hypothetical protein